MTKKQAKEYCLIKWDYARKTGCDSDVLDEWLLANNREIWSYKSSCGYCEMYKCSNCPLSELWGEGCCSLGSPYYKWEHVILLEDRKKYAEQIYQDIKRS